MRVPRRPLCATWARRPASTSASAASWPLPRTTRSASAPRAGRRLAGLRRQDFQIEQSVCRLKSVGARPHDAAACFEPVFAGLCRSPVRLQGRTRLHLHVSQNDVSLSDLVRHGDAFSRCLSFHRAVHLCCNAAILSLTRRHGQGIPMSDAVERDKKTPLPFQSARGEEGRWSTLENLNVVSGCRRQASSRARSWASRRPAQPMLKRSPLRNPDSYFNRRPRPKGPTGQDLAPAPAPAPDPARGRRRRVAG